MLRTDQAKVKSMPSGWAILQFHECRCRHDRDAVVLCERSVEDGDHGTRYVVWWVNMELGGCYHGHYTDDQHEAEVMYAQRLGRLQ